VESALFAASIAVEGVAVGGDHSGEATVRPRLYSTRKAAEERLAALGVTVTMPSRLLPPATAPPQLALAF